MDSIKSIIPGILKGLLTFLFIGIIVSCGCTEGSVEENYNSDFIKDLKFSGNESEIELVKIALKDERVSGTVFNHSFETEIGISRIGMGDQEPKEASVVKFWLFDSITRPNNEYMGIYTVYINDSKQIIHQGWDYPPRYPSDFPDDMKVNLTDRSVCTYRIISEGAS